MLASLLTYRRTALAIAWEAYGDIPHIPAELAATGSNAHEPRGVGSTGSGQSTLLQVMPMTERFYNDVRFNFS